MPKRGGQPGNKGGGRKPRAQEFQEAIQEINLNEEFKKRNQKALDFIDSVFEGDDRRLKFDVVKLVADKQVSDKIENTNIDVSEVDKDKLLDKVKGLLNGKSKRK